MSLVTDIENFRYGEASSPRTLNHVYDRIIKSRTLKANDEIALRIATFDNEALARMGYERSEILSRRRSHLPVKL